MHSANNQETNLTISEFVSLGSHVDQDLLGHQQAQKNLQNPSPLNIKFDSSAKRLIQYFCFYQTGDQLCGRDRAYLDNSTVPCHIMKFSAEDLIYTLLRTNIKTSEILRIIWSKNCRRLIFFICVLIVSSPVLQELLNPQVGLLTAILFQLILIIGSCIGPFIAFIYPGYFYKRISQDFTPSYITPEKQTSIREKFREYFIDHHEDLRKFTHTSESAQQFLPSSKQICLKERLKNKANNWIRNTLLENGILLTTKDVERWIEIATGSKIQALINEGENKKTISAKEYIERKLAEAQKKFKEKLSAKQNQINDLVDKLKTEEKLRKQCQDDLKNKEIEIENYKTSSKLNAEALEYCPTVINNSMPNVTVGKVISTLRNKNKNISRASIVQFMTAIDMSADFPVSSKRHEVKNIAEVFENAALRTWEMLYPTDIQAINLYEKKSENNTSKNKIANFSMKKVSYFLFVDNARAVNENPEHPRNCDYETLLSLRCPQKNQ